MADSNTKYARTQARNAPSRRQLTPAEVRALALDLADILAPLVIRPVASTVEPQLRAETAAQAA